MNKNKWRIFDLLAQDYPNIFIKEQWTTQAATRCIVL